MQKAVILLISFFSVLIVAAQPSVKPGDKITVPVINAQRLAIAHATVELLRASDSALVKAGITDSSGVATFEQVSEGVYLFRVTVVNYQAQYSTLYQLPLIRNSGTNSGYNVRTCASCLKGSDHYC